MIGENTARNDPDSVLTVRFYMRSEKNNFLSEKEGRPIFFEEPYIQIMVPGNQHLTIDTPVREEHKRRFPKQWAIFENSNKTAETEQIVGTPLEQWPAITRQQAEELKGRKFYTVEQIANCTEQQAQALGMSAVMLRQKAQAYLLTAKDTAIAANLAAENERIKKEQAEKDAKHAAEIAELRSLIEQATARKKPGRPKKVAVA